MSKINQKRSWSVAFAALVGLGIVSSAQAAIVGFWGMAEGAGTTVADGSGNGNTGTLTAGGGGTPSWGTATYDGSVDNVVNTHGYQDRIVVGNTAPLLAGGVANLGITGDFTVAMWANASYLGSYPYLIEMSNNSTGSARQWFIQGDNSGGDQMYVWSDANIAWKKGLGFKVGGGGNANAWHQYTFTYTKSTGQFLSYVDGTLKSTLSIGANQTMPGFTSVQIGGSGRTAFDSWEGGIDDVLILNNSVSASDVTNIMNETGAYALEVPLPAAAWTGLTLLGGLAIARYRRNKLA